MQNILILSCIDFSNTTRKLGGGGGRNQYSIVPPGAMKEKEEHLGLQYLLSQRNLVPKVKQNINNKFRESHS